MQDTEARIVTNEKTGGQKGAKPVQYSLMPWKALDHVALVLHYGSEKYSAHNWRRGFDWSLAFDAAMRHLKAFWEEGEDLDPEDNEPHLAHAIVDLLFLLTFLLDEERYGALDDRPGTLERRALESAPPEPGRSPGLARLREKLQRIADDLQDAGLLPPELAREQRFDDPSVRDLESGVHDNDLYLERAASARIHQDPVFDTERSD